jgi:vacuolar protein sorting-associated protein 13A/C
LDVNVTSTFIELALSTVAELSDTGDALRIDRPNEAPYKIRNWTGLDLLLWPDRDNNSRSAHARGIKLKDRDVRDWEFDDPKTMREASTFIL